METVLLIFSFMLAAMGILGTVSVGSPSIPWTMAGMLVMGFATDFAVLTADALIRFFLIMAAVLVLYHFSCPISLKRRSTSRTGRISAFFGASLGAVWLGPLGLALGTLVGGIVGEFASGDWRERLNRFGMRSYLLAWQGVLVQIAVAIGMLATMVKAVTG